MVDDKFKTSEKSPGEKRKHSRLDVSKTDSPLITIGHNDIILTACKLINLSTGGAAVVVRQPNDLDVGSRIKKITVKFPDEGEKSSPAIVRHVTRETGAKWNRYGVEVEGWQKL